MDTIVPPQDTPTKQCTKCLKTKPATSEYFYFNKQRNRLFPECKQCSAEAQRNRAQEVNQYHREYRQSHRDEIQTYEREYIRQYRKLHPEWTKGQSKKSRLTNPEQRRERARLHERAHRALRRESERRFYAEHSEQERTKSRNRRALKKSAQGTHTAEDIQVQYNRQKGKCYWCHRKVINYHVDHVIPLSRGGSNDPSNLVIACPSCNCSRCNKLPHEWAQGGKLL